MIAAIVAKIKALYEKIVAHLTKLLGAIGLAVSAIDPSAIDSAASQYLGANAHRKLGGALFALVIARGWWVGVKTKALTQAVKDVQRS